jgi:phytoene dehydrogenase-like protein
MSNLLIIGSGPNALASAFYLARTGFKPVVYERSGVIGGGAITGELAPGFRCPTLTHEVLMHEDVVRDMALERHGAQFLYSDVDAFAPSLDGPPLTLFGDVSRTAAGLRSTNAGDAERWPEFRQAVDRLASMLAPVFAAAPPDIDKPGARDLLSLLAAGRRFRGLGRTNAFRLLRWLPMPVADLTHDWFATESLRALVAGPGLSATMLGPRSAGSTLVLLLREVHRILSGGRARQVRGGPGALTSAMAAAAREAGAEFHTDAEVERIVTDGTRVVAAVVAGREVPARVVVSGADPKATLLSLVDPADLGPELRHKFENYRASGTMAKVNLALSALPAFAGVQERDLLAGRIHIGPSLDYMERAFDHVKYGEMSEEPWLDVRIPTLLDPRLAPEGAHVASIYVHCAPRRLRAGAWDAHRDNLLERTLDVLERHAPGVRADVVAAQAITPAALEAVFGFTGGHVFHGELAPDQLFAMRPLIGYARYRTPIEGLYLCGAGTHPGGFLTGASGRLAAAEVARVERPG